MRIRVSPPLFLVIGATVAVLLGCSSAPASSTTDDTSSPVAAADTQPPPIPSTDTQPPPDSVDIGYEVGLRAPAFGMSLLDGDRVTSSDLNSEGKPVFLYFHATF